MFEKLVSFGHFNPIRIVKGTILLVIACFGNSNLACKL